MSQASERGRNFEERIAKTIRKILKIDIKRDGRSGAGVNKSDLMDWYLAFPFHVELKDHESISVKEWYRQAKQHGTAQRPAAMFFAMGEDNLAVLSVEELLHLIKRTWDLETEIAELRKPVNRFETNEEGQTVDVSASECRNGHIIASGGKCLQPDCPFSHGYRPPKEQRKKR